MVRAKFKCIQKSEVDGGTTIGLEVVYSGSAENDSFFRYTPSGQISMGTINEAAAAQFEVGKEYYVDFTPAN